MHEIMADYLETWNILRGRLHKLTKTRAFLFPITKTMGSGSTALPTRGSPMRWPIARNGTNAIPFISLPFYEHAPG